MAYTPSSFSEPASSETLKQLEFGSVLECVARHAVSLPGGNLVRARIPSASLEFITTELNAVSQLQNLLDSGDPFRPEVVIDVAAILNRLDTAGTVLEPAELNALAGTLNSTTTVRAELERISREAPLVERLIVELPPHSLARAIERAIDADGTVLDEASPELAKARRRVRETRANLVRMLEKNLRDLGQEGEAGAPTMRGDRYVIPVRKDFRDRISGIVHGESGSGASLFIEPAGAVELGNELSSWEAREARAVLAVLRDLTEQVRPYSTLVAAGQEMCARADDLYARARYAIETDGHAPTMHPAPATLGIVRGFHPLILEESKTPIPFELQLSSDEWTLLLSGPNAGGKTVLLKSLGLLSSLAQAGIVPPVGPGSTLPVFGKIFADIGDHQSIAENLSTFTAHVAALKEILLAADETALILLDELGGGTDPVDGAALAGAVLQSLNARRSVTVASTHLGELKELVAQTDGAVNGSMQFDLETLSPTFRFIKHQPGRSYGLEIARSVGLPDEVLALAERLQPEQIRSVDAILAELEKREEDVACREEDVSLAAARMDKDRQAVDGDRERITVRETALAERERVIEQEGRERARGFLLEARRRVDDALGLARAAVSEATAREARRLVEEGVREEGDALEKLEQLAKAKGWRITGSRDLGSTQVSTRTGVQSSPISHSLLTDSSTEIDLRGMTGDEAESALVLALDGTIAADLPWLRIIHGKGTGALRARVAQVLKGDRRVEASKLAPPEQGGSGVTVAELSS